MRIGIRRDRMAEFELCQEFVEGSSRPEAPLLLAKGIKSKTSDLLSVVESLGVYLTSTVTRTRCRATELLSDVLCNVCTLTTTSVLPQQDVHYLVTFYCARMCERTELHPPVLKGLHAMVITQDLHDDVITTIAQTMLREVHVQSMGQAVRRMVFEMVQMFLFKYTTVVQRMGTEFVLGVIKAVDGEKDPRNLTVVFSCIPVLAQHLELGVLTEDLFEVVACYFPIDFVPPPNDPFPVTQDDLVGGLRRCLTATPSFAQYCIPLVLEKLSSDLHTAKVDALLTLAAGGSVFGEAGLAPHIEQLWPSIRKEVLRSHDKVIQAAGLEAIRAITRGLCSPLSPRPSQLIALCLRDLKRNIVESELKLMLSSCQLLLAVAMAADPACVLVVREVVPVLVQRLSQSQPAHRRVLLEMVASFAGVAQQFGNQEVASPLEPYKDMLLHTLLSALGGDQLELKAPALRLAPCVFSMLSGPELQACVQCMYELAVDSSDPQLRYERRFTLCELCGAMFGGEARGVLRLVVKRLDANVVMALVSPLLMGIDTYKAGGGAMSLLAVLSHQQEVLVAMVPSLLAALEKPQTLQSAANLCGAVREVVEEVCRDPSSHPLLCSLLLPRLLQLTVCADPPLTGEETVGHVAAIVRAVTRAVDSSLSRGLVDTIVNMFAVPQSRFTPLEPSGPPPQTQLVEILSTSLCSLSPQDLVPYIPLLPRLCQLACVCAHPPTSHHAAMCYASCINKMAAGEVLEEVLSRDMASIWSCVGSPDLVVKANAISMAMWLAKALAMRGHIRAQDLVFKLFRHGFENEAMASIVIRSFEVLFSDQTIVLCEQSHASIKLLYKQRLFEQLLPAVLVAFKEDRPSGSKEYCLLVLSCLLQSVPQQVLTGELPSVLPLLLASLEGKDTSLSAVQALSSLTRDQPTLIAHHVSSILTALMKLSVPPHPLKLRASSLHCIGLLSTLPHHQIYPHRTMAVQGIAGCLDDHKRIVRKEAINSRSLWLELGGI